MKIKMLFTFFAPFCFLTMQAQLQIGYNYLIKKNRRDNLTINYTLSDTTWDANLRITAIAIHNYISGAANSVVVDKNNPAYNVTITTTGALDMCSKKLKGSAMQKEKDASGKVYITYWGITSTGKCAMANQINETRKLGEFYYQITGSPTLGNVTKYVVMRYRTCEIGIATIPFKYHSGFAHDTTDVPNDFSAGVNAGLYVGKKWGSTHFFADQTRTRPGFSFLLGLFVSPMVLPLDNTNTFGTTDVALAKKLKTKSSQPGLSTGLAAQLTISKDFSFGLYYGKDFGLNAMGKDWYYNNKTWIGFGIGYKLSMLGEK